MREKKTSTRNGKIARLPAAVREEVCRRLHEGETGPKIIRWLHTLPEVLAVLDEYFGGQPFSKQNLTQWRGGGYQDWLRKKEKVENMRQLSAFAFDMGKAGGSIAEGAAAIAGGRILEFLEVAEQGTLVELTIALAKLRDSEAKSILAHIAKASLERKDRQLDLADRQFALSEKKFQYTTAEKFLDWAESSEARAIIRSDEPKKVRMDKLVHLMFGDRPA